ncbi:uncharacterized protein THITE_2065711 [Thermothielavioides terrestris NRRL 8126]|jgi:hypothetical protein|uniref:Signal peptide-containing protein n=1 Tax=Thermothielavioides terrestris (strain ATCC 38088 / NRRL 8126) TaxID=578455 RepID=G2R2X0_THETT|nr:uncharacterized protein THITE_2065711 [Thermothielavioides terrestris NRRL 8126]AEO65886.1 hypothetical protein THITE_2065711 [Thermothielavioides terrestris NRRL 8126]
MSFLVAVQSAIFYFLACTPCHEFHHQHKTRQHAKRERQRKERIVMEQPHLYRHPDPFHTNPYWDEEIRMGPSLPKKRRGSEGIAKSLSQRRLTAASRDGRPSIGTGSSVVVSMSELGSIASPRPSTSPANAQGLASAPTVVPEEEPTSPALSKTASISTNADWNLKRYQREDEELWGHESAWSGRHKLMDAIKHAGTTAGRYMESKLGLEKQITDEDRYNFYFTPRNPPVNDYHPPVVSSRPAHKDALRWMLQPPPPAKVMEGKVPVSRSASTMSAASRRTVSTRDGGSLGRLVGEKAVEARIRRGETPLDDARRSTPSLQKSRSRVSTAARTRSRRTTATSSSATESEEETDEMSSRKRRVNHRPPGVEESEDEDEGIYLSKSPNTLSNASLSTHAAQKPRLPTILSSGHDDRASSSVDSSDTAHPLRDITNTSSTPDLDKLAQPAIPVGPDVTVHS